MGTVISLTDRRRSPLLAGCRYPVAEARMFTIELTIEQLASLRGEEGWWWHRGPDAWQLDTADGVWRFHEEQHLLLHAAEHGARPPKSLVGAPTRSVYLSAAAREAIRGGMSFGPEYALHGQRWQECRGFQELFAVVSAGADAFAAASTWGPGKEERALYELHASGRLVATCDTDSEDAVKAALRLAAVLSGCGPDRSGRF